MSKLTKYAKHHEDYSYDHLVEAKLRCDIRLWAQEYERNPEDRIQFDQDVLNRVEIAREEIRELTGYDPVVIPRLQDAMSDQTFMKSIVEEGCAFVAADMPEGSMVMVQAYRLFFKAGTEIGIQRHYRKNNERRLEKGRSKRQEKKTDFIAGLTEKISDLENEGAKTYQAIADRLNQEGTPTPSGRGIWHINTVQRVKKGMMSTVSCDIR